MSTVNVVSAYKAVPSELYRIINTSCFATVVLWSSGIIDAGGAGA